MIAGKIGGTRSRLSITARLRPRIIGSHVNTAKFRERLLPTEWILSGKNGIRGLIDDRGLQYAPRLGIAYQFLPKTVLRVGREYSTIGCRAPGVDMCQTRPSIALEVLLRELAAIPSASARCFSGRWMVSKENGQVSDDYNGDLIYSVNCPETSVRHRLRWGGINHIIYRYTRTRFRWSRMAPQNRIRNASPSRTAPPATTNFYRPYQGYANNRLRFRANSNTTALQVWPIGARQGSAGGIAYTW